MRKSCDAASSIPSLNFMFINLLLHHSTEVASMDYHLKGPSGLRLRGVCVYVYMCVCPLLWWSWIWFSGQIQDTIHIIQYPSPPPPCRRHGNTRAPDIQQPICGQTSDCFDDSKWFTLGAVANFTTVLRACIFTSAVTNQTQVPLATHQLVWNNHPTTMIRACHEATMPPWDPKKFNLTWPILCPSIMAVSQHWSPETQFDSLSLSA